MSAQTLSRLKAGIRAECARQGIDDGTRRAMMKRLAGVDSSCALDLKGAHAILDHLHSSKEKLPSAGQEWTFVFRATPARQKYLKKIYRLSQTIGLWQAPPVPVMSKAWVEGTVKQMSGLNLPETRLKTLKPLEFCDAAALRLVIMILAEWCRKNGRDPNTGAART
jgi:hypothetical protein